MAAQIIELRNRGAVEDYLGTPTRTWKGITLHHTYRPTTRQYAGGRTVEAIQKYHLSKGWRDIGYHLLVGPDGKVFTGRRLDEIGAHAVIHNSILARELGGTAWLNEWTLGVCCIGDYDTEKPSSALTTSLDLLDVALHERFKIQGHWEHRMATAKTCPGEHLWNYPWPCLSEVVALLRSDRNRPSEWAKETWGWFTDWRIVDGKRPRDLATREEVAVMIERRLKREKEGG